MMADIATLFGFAAFVLIFLTGCAIACFIVAAWLEERGL